MTLPSAVVCCLVRGMGYTLALAFGALSALALAQGVRDYVVELEPESPAARVRRQEQVEARRRGPVLMVHRGASALAPENTLSAYARAMDFGADGVEVDVRRTADGVLVLFHDEVLDRLTHGLGTVNQLPARALLALEPRLAFGRPIGGTPPSFLQLLDLARQRAMLLHLDVKEDGLADQVARALDAADCWDHVVAINPPHAARLLADPRFRPLRYKVPGLYAGRQDLDPGAVEQALRQPGQMILVDDPRVAAGVLGREPYAPVALTQRFRYTRPSPPTSLSSSSSGHDPGPFNAAAHLEQLALRVSPDSEPQLLGLVEAPVEWPGQGLAAGDGKSPLAARIVERAWAADRLGQLGRKSRVVVKALEGLVERPGAHPDWRFHGLDGALAARALGQLRASESAPRLIAAFRRSWADPASSAAGDRATNSTAWAEARFKLHLLAALGDLRCRAARRFLLDLAGGQEPTGNSGLGSIWHEDATRALLRQNLAWDAIARLLRSPGPAVRGTAMIECVDWPNEERRKALSVAAGWALALPGVPYADFAPPPPARPRQVTPAVAPPPKHTR